MISRKLLPFIAVLSFASPSFAESTPAPADKKEEAKEEAKPEKTHYSSAENRVGKMASVMVESGLGVGAIPTSGLDLAYFISPDLQAQLSYVSGSLSILDFTVDASLLEIGAKYFIGNSFYAIGSLGHRTIGLEGNLDASTVGGKKVAFKVDTQSTGLSFGIGNHWQWGGFTLGCQWIGYFMPLSSSGDTDLDVTGADEKDKKDLQDSIDGLAKTPSYQLLRLALGWSF